MVSVNVKVVLHNRHLDPRSDHSWIVFKCSWVQVCEKCQCVCLHYFIMSHPSAPQFTERPQAPLTHPAPTLPLSHSATLPGCSAAVQTPSGQGYPVSAAQACSASSPTTELVSVDTRSFYHTSTSPGIGAKYANPPTTISHNHAQDVPFQPHITSLSSTSSSLSSSTPHYQHSSYIIASPCQYQRNTSREFINWGPPHQSPETQTLAMQQHAGSPEPLPHKEISSESDTTPRPLRDTKILKTEPQIEYDSTYKGKLPPFNDLASHLRCSVTAENYQVVAWPTQVMDGQGSSPSSRSSSCSSEDFDADEEQTPQITELGLAAFNFDEVDLDPMLEDHFLSDVSSPLEAMMKMEPGSDVTSALADDAALAMSEFGLFSGGMTPHEMMSAELSDSEGYDSSPEQPGCSSLVPQTYYDLLGDHFRQIPEFPAQPSIVYRHSSPDSDEGFVDEPNVHENLPNFEKIQLPSNEKEKSPSPRHTPASPKEKRKTTRSPQMTDNRERRKPGRKPGQVSNVLHLWEFMRDLLHSPGTQGIIEWISRSEGVFRVVNSNEVAKLWGKKKKNKKEMTYEKLSRSLRYSREEGYFCNLPKDKNYPKKLCFKFGPKSQDWQ